ncbi:PREDICTED: uncharacterized protein LOC108371934 [Rhagoletis zephyria]|uniref:uncharacterized protein LOC108371934 n=2 Tax=Rhagoletis zephyria TaxID=28612 RepID=UPI0008112E08|nr:PREDICTED: uncharacterized protein LOC108371934 [Rhagoletis zephyria]
MAMLTRRTSPGSPKAFQRFQNCIAFLWPSLNSGTTQTNSVQRKSTQMDAIDCLTNELVSRNSKKWDELRDSFTMKSNTPDLNASSYSENNELESISFGQNVNILSKGVVTDLQAIRSPQLGLDIRSLSQAQLDNLLLSTVEIKNKPDFLYLIRQCVRHQQLPSNEVLVSCLKYLMQLCRLQQIESLADLCKLRAHPLIKVYANFAPFKAMALWRSGSADVALMTLHRGYSDCIETDEGRRMARNVFRTIVEETLAQKSEAVLVSLMQVARSIYIEQKDIFVIACVWKQCFASEWFCDQKSATDLYEHYTELQQLVAKRSSSLSSSFIRANNIDAVHRLIEAFLQKDQRDACANCLSILFNHQYLRGDLRACAEIIKSCSELDMPLSEVQNEQFLSLFLNQPAALGSRNNESYQSKPVKEYQYKF